VWDVLSSVGPGFRAWNQVSYDGRPLLAGGATGGGRYSNDFWALENDVWREIIPHAGTQEPTSREHHSFVHCPKDGKHYFWQGHTGTSANNWATPEMHRKIWRINGEAWEYTGSDLPVTNGMRMSGGNCWCPPLDGFLTIGGANLDVRATYLLRHSDMQQVKLDTIGDPVGPLSPYVRFNINNQAQWVSELNLAVVFGGQITTTDGLTLNDLRVFNPSTLTWTDQPTTNTPPSRSFAALVYRPGKLAVFGGLHRDASSTPGVHLADLWELDLQTWEWTRLEDAPSVSYMHGGIWDGSRYVFFGGGQTLTYTPSGGVSMNVPSTITAEVLDA